jgi:stage III sporulation protein AH
MNRKKVWAFSISLVALVTILFVAGVEKEMSKIEIFPEEELFKPIISGEFSEDPSQWKFDDTHAFFVEYRLERDRVRGQEMEMLNDMINNPQVGAEARREAEMQLLNLVDMMEKELIVENLLKAQGYADAILFVRKGASTVMLHTEQLGEDDFLRVAEMVSAIIGVAREQVQIIQQT